MTASVGTLIRYARPLSGKPVLEKVTLEMPQSANGGAIARIVLSHAKQNILDFQMMDELSASLDQLAARRDLSTILIEAAGEHFSAGVDIPSHTPEKVATMLEKFHGVIRRLLKIPKVTVAAVKGACLGGGAELAMTCDIVITTDAAHWGFPEIRLGCYPPVAAAALASVVGQKRAAELILTGRSFDGREAERIGLANRAVPADTLKETASEYVHRLAELSPAALTNAKRALYAWDAAHFEKGLARAEDIYLKDLVRTEDAQEGIRAWMEKRSPRWTGK
ncbi:MAG TPA: enoyl-CoA hydratase/isomerase family protein [Terriglobales bacterium]|nr:enoyl-CoA hydratase/isomerase family protein [Terriglobales bacterium]